MITQKHIDLMSTLYDLKLIDTGYINHILEAWEYLLSLDEEELKTAIEKYHQEAEKCKGVEGCIDWIKDVEEIYEKLKDFFK